MDQHKSRYARHTGEKPCLTRPQYASRYRVYTDENLALLEADGGLIPEAKEALAEEIERRKFSPAVLREEMADFGSKERGGRKAALRRALHYAIGFALAAFAIGFFGLSLGAIPTMAVYLIFGFVADLLLRGFKWRSR